MRCVYSDTGLSSVLPPLLVTEFILGVLGNSFALWIFCFYLKPWKNSTVLLFNLAVADFLLIMVLPFRAGYFYSNLEWKFGNTFCNISLFMLAMNRSGSAFFLMAIAVDRHMRVVYPQHPINFLNISKAMCGAGALWLLAISMNSHVFTLKHTNTTNCATFIIETEPHTSLTWHRFVFLFSFYVPLLVILYCTVSITRHLRARQIAHQAKVKKALRLIIVVVVIFIICFFPSNITQVIIWFKINKVDDTQVCAAMKELNTAFKITIILTYLNSVVDPVVYYFSSSVIKKICRKVLCRRPQRQES